MKKEDFYPYSYEKTTVKTFWGAIVYKAYCFDQFVGYRIKRSKKEQEKFKNQYKTKVVPKVWLEISETDFVVN